MHAQGQDQFQKRQNEQPFADHQGSASTTVSSASRRGRILVVDDDRPVAESLRLVLEDDFDVVVATTSADARAAIDADPNFDVILCDVSMPEETGTQFHRALQVSHPDLADRLVFMTGGRQPCEADDHASRPPQLNKPFDFATLSALLRRFVPA